MVMAQQRDVCEEDTEYSVWYFGYGSMCNEVSLRRRGILPVQSCPATLAGYELQFGGSTGMANLIPLEGGSLHGILHRITPAMFKALAAVEAVYDVVDVECVPYAPAPGAAAPAAQLPPSPVVARAFIIPMKRLVAAGEALQSQVARALPSSRYIRIITAGLLHYGADPAWIHSIRTQPCRPTRSPADYLRLPVPAASADSLPRLTLAQVQQHKGQLPAVFALDGRVYQVEVVASAASSFAQILKHNISGTDVVFGMVQNLYEPLLPEVSSPADIGPEHIAWAEDQCVEWMGANSGLQVTQIGWLAHDSGVEAAPQVAAAT